MWPTICADGYKRQIKNIIGAGEGLLYLAKMTEDSAPRTYISAQEVMSFYEKLSRMNQGQIQDEFGVNAEYASLLMPCAMIYKRVMELTGAEIFWIPSNRP